MGSDWSDLADRPLPEWFGDAKFGIFLHWGLYSVPGWAARVADVQTMMREAGPDGLLRDNPYAAWYANTMQIEGSPTAEYHAATYGPAFPYPSFAEAFDEGSRSADLDALADLCARGGAQYVVLTTKHHEGFCLWPTDQRHPRMGEYRAQRDLVGDMTEAVRNAGMRMGLYYSGGYDWPWNDAVIRSAADMVLATPADDYVDYAEAHVRELIHRYEPSILWNDVCWPPGGDLPALFAEFYDTVPDGVVNDRWRQSSRTSVGDAATRAAGMLVQLFWRVLPEKTRSLTFPTSGHFDFATPEYAQRDEIVAKKWESTRGIGHAFAYNRNEDVSKALTVTELVRSFADIVSKNGNLLLGIGPRPDGTIPDWQREVVLGMGEWLSVNGDAIYGTRPWERCGDVATDGTAVRFTATDESLFAILLATPGQRRLLMPGVVADGDLSASLLGYGDVPVSATEGGVELTLPDRLPTAPAHAVRLTPVSVLSPAVGA
jgi:alpha-L-fucosidase